MYIVASDYDGTLKQNGIVSKSDLEAYKRDAYYLAELIERYDISKNYIDVIEDYS